MACYNKDTVSLILKSTMITMYQKTSMTKDCASNKGMHKTMKEGSQQKHKSMANMRQ